VHGTFLYTLIPRAVERVQLFKTIINLTLTNSQFQEIFSSNFNFSFFFFFSFFFGGYIISVFVSCVFSSVAEVLVSDLELLPVRRGSTVLVSDAHLNANSTN